jgi:leader peptidase (prepilin peptidase)/N-methyltransferase
MSLEVIFLHIFIVLIGISLGSFCTALAWRVSNGMPWAFNKYESSGTRPVRSQCIKCNHELSVLDLIPLLSWLFNKGRCRYCKEPIGIRYPIIELLNVILVYVLFLSYGLNIYSFFLILTVPFLVALLVIDLETYLLPNQLMLISFVLFLSALVSQLTLQPELSFLIDHLLGLVIYPLIVFIAGWLVSKLKKRQALGFGDVKFFILAGMILGISSFPDYLILSGCLGVILGLIWSYIKKIKIFPFGPALIIALYLLLIMKGFNVTLLPYT